jgi:hypothetical protein
VEDKERGSGRLVPAGKMTQMANASLSGSRPRNPYRWAEIVVVFAIVIVGIVIFGPFGDSRTEFSPDSLDCRQSTQGLLFEWRYGTPRYQLVQYLIDKGYWQPRSVAEPKWLPAYYRDQYRGHYAMVGRLLSRSHQTKKEWTEAHPEMASRVWPWLLHKLRTEEDCNPYIAEAIWMYVQEAKDIEEFKNLLKTDSELRRIDTDALD